MDNIEKTFCYMAIVLLSIEMLAFVVAFIWKIYTLTKPLFSTHNLLSTFHIVIISAIVAYFIKSIRINRKKL